MQTWEIEKAIKLLLRRNKVTPGQVILYLRIAEAIIKLLKAAKENDDDKVMDSKEEVKTALKAVSENKEIATAIDQVTKEDVNFIGELFKGLGGLIDFLTGGK